MKLTKKLEAEVLKAYKAYWDAYLSGDMKAFASILDDDITVFGTAVSEVFNNKKETVRFYKATADQLVGKAQFRNRKINVNEVDNNVLVNEQSDLYFLMDKRWSFYGHVRVSAVFKHTGTGWKLVHQHASFPDIRAEEGEQIAAEKIKAENLQLRDAVKRRTIELEEKNRELEIETSLEKVRAQALGMRKADELLNVCKVLFKELIALGFTGLRNAIIHSFNDDKAYFTDYDYSDTTGGAITNISYNENPIIKKFIKQIRKSDNAFVQVTIKGNELKNWKRFRKKGGQPDDPLLNKAAAVHYYLHSIENAAIGISAFNVINKEQLQLLKRFRNVFDFAYRRYMDIAQAEAQTREAQIEVAVERVRSKALAMHRSDEIHEVVRALRNELFGLKLEGIIGATICLKQSDGKIRFWDITDVETTGRYGWDIVFDIGKIDVRLWVKKIWDSKKQIISTEQDLSDLKRALKWLGQYDKETADEILKLLKINNIKHGWHRAVRLAHGRLITDFSNEPPSEIDSILLKIGVAFDLAYRRFLDLQKAEAQAREAKIEASLERVRAKTMAMHKSHELLDVVKVLGEQFELLGFKFQSVNFDTDSQEKDWNLWLYNVGSAMYPGKIHIPYIDHPCFNKPLEAFKKGGDLHSFIFTKAEKDSLFDHIYANSVAKFGSDERKRFTYAAPGFALSIAVTKNTRITIANYNAEPFSEEENAILRRFANVFEQSYTRFLDLQKAEAQARDAKIEASLERVRAKTMAMHKSADLLDVVKTLGEQFELLGFKFNSVNFNTDYLEKDWNLWLYNSGAPMYPDKLHIPYIDHPCFNKPLDAIRKGVDLMSFVFTKEEKDSLFDHIYTNSIARNAPEERKKSTYAARGLAMSVAVSRNTSVTITNYNAEPFSEEENAILRRFANVFEQSYTRFLDLQKAEAQAREAEIELALERVRARTMAMQKSDELREAVLVIYEQLKLLHFESSACNIIIIDKESNSAQYWVSGFSQEIFPVSYTVPYFNHPYQDALLKPWRQGDKYVVYEYAGKMKQNFDQIFFTQTDFKNVPAAAKNVMIGIKSVMLSTAFMTYGALQTLGAEPLSDEKANILQRFAKVFEQTYTRFLDLQKAEAQAREAQIEAALERVRSRTMAMQKTDELLDAAELVHKELAALGINSMNVSYAFVDEEKKYGSYYSINPVDGKIVPIPFVFPHTETEVMRSILTSWKKQESYNVIELKEKATLKHQTYIGEHIQRQLAKINVPFSIEEFLSVSPKKAVLSTFNFANGYLFNIGEERLSKIQEDLMLRFTRVFEQTYTRFLDLQKAEAQAREAQIEAALERVRSRTMGMQKSDELKEVIQVVYEQFVHLNIHVEHTGFIMDYKKRDDMHIWLADKHAVPFQVTLPYFDCAHWNSFKEAKEKGIDFFANQLSFEEKNKFYQDLFKLIPGVPEETLEYYFSCPGLAISTVLLENVGLYIENFSGLPYTNEENNTLMRFGKVFQQTYTRFLDLQKAEAQAREAQIETALEKVRSHTMGMRSSDDLANVATVMFDQMRILGGDLFSFGIVLCDKHENMVEQWHSIPHAGMLAPFFVPVDLDHIHRFRYDQWKAGVELFSIVIPEDYITHHFDLMLKLPSVKAVWEGIAAKGIQLPAIPTWEIDYGASFKYGYLLVSALKPFEEDKIFPRFAKVFEQAYTRFLDLQKAEAQARESQIEAALERVRSRTMAMQRSEELLEVINIFSDQLTKLNIYFDNVSFGVNDQADDFKFWLSSAGQPHPIQIEVPYYNNPAPNRVLEAQKKGLKFFADILTAEENKLWVQHLIAHSELKALPDNVKNYLLTSPGFARSTFILKNINLYIGNFKNIAYTEEENNIFKKFAQAFEQSYIRFLDLQKAEAQAREAQIELGLERVRARAMAMQNSDELKELIGTVFTELTKLDLVLTRCLIVIFDPKTNGSTWWMANSEAPSDPIGLYVKYHDHPPYLSYVKAWQERNLKWQYILEGKDKKEWDDFLFVETELSHLPDFVIAGMKAPDRVYLNASFNSFGNLTLASLEPLSNEHFDILLRFAKVFDLTYTRFNDLKQAEAQAREAQIELGLERVRARAMAMQKSDELSELVDTVFKELTKLDFALTWCIINIIDEPSLSNTVWAANPDINKAPESYHMLFEDYPFHHAMMKAWKERRTRHIYVLEGQEKKIYDEYLFNETEFRRVPAAAQAASRAMEKYVVSFSFSNFGGLQTVGDVPLSDANLDILSRFGKVFDLTYTRFNDLKQAEAQARESQIQLAMERVRARTMAMQKSDELSETSFVLFQQFRELGSTASQMSIGIIHENENFMEMSATIDGNQLDYVINVSLDEPIVMKKLVTAWKEQKRSLVIDIYGDELRKYNEYRNSIGGKFKFETKEGDHWVVHIAFFSKGMLSFSSHERHPDETVQLLERFAAVFDLTYTRFLDLKNAEAQARESQIQLALERVRARTMAMQHSEELAETATVLFEQFNNLGEVPERIAIGIMNEEEHVFDIWATQHGGTQMNLLLKLSLDEPHVMKKMYQAWKEQSKFITIDLQGNELEEYFQFLKKSGASVQREIFGDRRIENVATFSKGVLMNITTEPRHAVNKILERFAGVFDQTYTRFLDLQKAEAQARESELELALERVRAKSMSMRHSDELADLVKIVFKELTRIGFSVNACIIMTYDERTNDSTWWISNFDDVSNPFGLFVPDHSNEPYLAYLNEWKKQTTKWRYKLGGDEKKKWDEYLFKNSGLATLPDMVKKAMQSAGETYLNVCFNKYASITFGSFEPMSEKDFDTLHRFAKVFEQSYTRFLDLQKAEAQAREANIETALERVRARTMGMHQSKELHDVIETVTNQLLALGLKFDNSVFCRVNEDESWEMWMSTPQQSYPAVIYVPYLDHRIFHNLKEVKAKNLEFYTDVFERDEAREFFKHFFENTIAKDVPEERKQYVLNSSGMARSLFLTKDIWFVISRYSPDPFNNEENGILKRFAKVFEQAYIRFRDLEKAEAQANEARVEIALERIRARALAMHKSDELMEVAKVMREQMALLGQADLEASAVHLYEEDPDNVLSWRAVTIGSDANREITYGHMAIPKNSCEFVQEWLTKFYSDLKEYTIELSGSKQQEWYEVLFKLAPEVINSMRQKHSMDEKRYYRFSKFSGGALLMIAKQEPSAEASYLQERAAVVFDLAYRRFSDLQKAEAQARESQIEAALERVRAKAMAMHSSKDLAETIGVFYRELKSLSVIPIRCGVALINKETRMAEVTTMNTTEQGDSIEVIGNIKMAGHPVLEGVYENWLIQKEYHAVLRGNQIKEYYQVLKPQIAYPDYSHDEVQFGYYFMFKEGDVYAWTETELTEDELAIYRRFTSVISLTYKRYNDLKQAEAQARESKIEASLERVRSKTMAMHNSQDVGETVATMFDELVKLGIETVRCGIAIIDESKTMEVWTASSKEDGSVKLIIGQLDMSTHPLFMQVYDAWKQKKSVTTYELVGEDLKDYFRNINNSPDYPIRYDIESLPYRQSNTAFMFPEGSLFVFSQEPLVPETIQIFKRFAGVFGQTYRRYLDLQKAEANAREAQIEAGLERVRARTMAMHSSEDVSMATATMFTELEKLGIENLRGGITIIRPDQTQEVWSITNLPDGRTIRAIGVFDMRLHPLWRALFKARENKADYDYYWLAGKDKDDYVKILNATPNYLAQPITEIPDVHVQSYFFGEGGVWTNSLHPHTEEDKQVMKRFTSVFSLTFRRYQDLKKAEAQAREATIEAALEKVRGKAMAMHSSGDLSTTASMVITELRKLGIKPIRCGVGILNKETNKAQLYTATSSSNGDSLSVVGWVLLEGHPVLEQIYERWSKGEDYFPELSGDSMRKYYEQLLAGLSVPLPEFKDDGKHYGHFLAISVGCLYAWADVKYNDDEIKILKRFATTIDLTFRRYFELQKSEANAKEAVKQAALDRIRADIASMRTINDLDRITPLIWNELTVLGIPFIRCGVFIMDEEQQLIHTFLSTPDGKAIAAFHLPYGTPGNISKVIDGWRHKKIYIDHWGEEEFIQFSDILMKQGALASREQYLKTIPHGGFHLHFLPFLQGMLYVGNTEQLNREQIELIQHVADAFSTAYARYEDFNKLEAAKQQVENTLTDLRQAQQQLVQSEKMASLGELTAGIAHEIQNPLNFVNNFSDVSNELLEEMKNELEKGNKDDAIAIVEDVKQNLEKILHHGKRADAIVKGMLQHSRMSSGQKEPTDINMLADEYLRLAFHGLRAKDKSFNAKFETEFDNSIGKINIIPQDIGRVVLNLINNAFYAVTEKKKHASAGSASNGYEPTVTLTTKKENGKVEIKVKDNGSGIPQKMLEKIFQPFFTTKPTGQGTGLGLSLAYDIVTKGHGGELKVETKEGEGSEFIIQLSAT